MYEGSRREREQKQAESTYMPIYLKCCFQWEAITVQRRFIIYSNKDKPNCNG